MFPSDIYKRMPLLMSNVKGKDHKTTLSTLTPVPQRWEVLAKVDKFQITGRK
jgi:hypothetical protein